MVAEPALQVVRGHPRAPAQFEQLRQVEAVDRDDDEGEREVGEAAELGPEHRLVLVLQRVVEGAVPVVEQHQQVHGREIERDDRGQQRARLPFLLRAEVWQRQPPGLAREHAEVVEFGGQAHGLGSGLRLATPLATCPAGTCRAAAATWPVWSSKKKSGSNSRRNPPLDSPPRNIASSTSTFQSISVRIARSCAGALRAVTSAVRMCMAVEPSRCSRCSAASSGANGPGGSGLAARRRSWLWNASSPPRWNTCSAWSENSTASPSNAMRTSSG